MKKRIQSQSIQNQYCDIRQKWAELTINLRMQIRGTIGMLSELYNLMMCMSNVSQSLISTSRISISEALR